MANEPDPELTELRRLLLDNWKDEQEHYRLLSVAIEGDKRETQQLKEAIQRCFDSRISKDQATVLIRSTVTEILKERVKHGPGPQTAIRIADTKSRREFWKAIIVQALITLGLVLAAWVALPKK